MMMDRERLACQVPRSAMAAMQPTARSDVGGPRRRRTLSSPKINLRRRRAVILLFLSCLDQRVLSFDLTTTTFNHQSGRKKDDDDVEFEDDPDCYDDRPGDCPGARHRGECWTMWESTLPACRSSCWLCVNATHLRQQNVTEDEIRRRRAFSRIDFGPLPSFAMDHPNPPPEVERTKLVVAAMDAYSRQFPRDTCTNSRAECPYWAALDQCGNNYDYMIQECRLACRYCDAAASSYLDCLPHSDNQKGGRRRRKPLSASHILKWKEWTLNSTEFHSRNVLGEASSTEWATLVDSFATPDELESIRSTLFEGMTFQPSAADGYDLHDTLPLHAQTDPDVPQIVRRTSTSADCDLSCIQQNSALQSVLKRLMALLRVPSTAYLERPVEFLSYGPVDTFAKHSDCRVHDAWKMGGHRAATAYVALNGSDATVGFPHFWEMVPVKVGQLLLWPNVVVDYSAANSGSNPSSGQGQSVAGVRCHANMTSEVLASPGTSQGLLVHVRLFPMDESVPAACR